MATPTKNSTIAIEIIIIILFLAGVYYLYNQFGSSSVKITISDNNSVLDANSSNIIKTVNSGKLNFDYTSIVNNKIVKDLKDFSEFISTSTIPGRDNPFIAPSYASPRPTH